MESSGIGSGADAKQNRHQINSANHHILNFYISNPMTVDDRYIAILSVLR